MKRWKMFSLLLLFSFMVWPVGLYAGDTTTSETEETYALEDVIVTATKTAKARGNVTQKVDVISKEELDQKILGNGNLAETVSHLPGAYVNVLARNQPNWGSVGGLGTNYNTYMLDGLPMDSFCDPMSIDPWIVERVEVQRGPASVLYPNFLSQDFSGNQSPLAGTTNFILRERVDDPGTRISTGYGDFNTLKIKADHRDRIGNFHYYLGGIWDSSDYTNYRYKLTTAASGMDMTEDPDYENKSLDFRSTYFFDNADDHKLSFYIHHQWHDGDMGRPNRELDHNYLTTHAKYQTPVGDWGSARFQLGYLFYDRNFGEDNYPTNLDSRGISGVDQEIIPGDLSLTIPHSGGGLLTVGTDFQFADYQWFNGESSSDLINDAQAYQFGIYLQEEYEIGSWILRVGGRYNYTQHKYHLLGGFVPEEDEQNWNSFVWSAGLRYKMGNGFSIYTNAGTSFLVPAAKYIGGTIRASDEGRVGYGGTLPNLDLEPEKGFAYDLGFDYEATKKLNFGMRGFLNLVDDAVVSNTVHEDVNQSQRINAGKCESYGLEMSLSTKVNNRLSAFANFTYTQTNLENKVDENYNDVELSGYPEIMGNIGAFFMLPYEIKASAWLRVVGPVWNSTNKASRVKLDGYEVLSMKLEKCLVDKPACRVDMFFDLDNIGNNHYKTIYYYQDPGFTVFGGLKFTF